MGIFAALERPCGNCAKQKLAWVGRTTSLQTRRRETLVLYYLPIIKPRFSENNETVY